MKKNRRQSQAQSDLSQAKSSETPAAIPFVERTNARGLVEMNFPGFEICFPATNRSIMVIALGALAMITIVVPLCFYEVFSARPESIESILTAFRSSSDKDRVPVSVPVKTDDGIEIIEVCPPCHCETSLCPMEVPPEPLPDFMTPDKNDGITF